MLKSLYIRGPKIVPFLELFSSKGGTFEFQGRNFRVPREELSSSSGGNRKFPTEEKKVSSANVKTLLLKSHFVPPEDPIDNSGDIFTPSAESDKRLYEESPSLLEGSSPSSHSL